MSSERRVESRSTRPRRGRRGPEPPPAPPVGAPGPAFAGDPSPDQRVSDFLAERFGSRVRDLRLIPLSGDASTRRYYRLIDGDDHSVISLNPEPFHAEQLPFIVIRNLMAGWGLPVLQEDLGDLSLQEALKEASPSRREELYRQALDQLVVLQREAARAPQRAICFQIAFDFEKLSWEMHFFWKHFLEGYRRCDLSVEDRASMADGFHRLCTEISSWPRVLTHRDFHSRNLMSYGDALYWIDFQDARMGPAHYDLASLLRDSYVELDEEFVADHPAQPEGAGHVRLPGNGEGKSRLSALHPAHAGARAAQPRAVSGAVRTPARPGQASRGTAVDEFHGSNEKYSG